MREQLITNPELSTAPQEALLENDQPEQTVDPNQGALDFEAAAAVSEEEQEQKDLELLASLPDDPYQMPSATEIAKMLNIDHNEAMTIRSDGTLGRYKKEAVAALEKKEWDAGAPAREEAARKERAAAKEAADKQWTEDHKWELEREKARNDKLEAEAKAVADREAEIKAVHAENARLIDEAAEAARTGAVANMKASDEYHAAQKAAQAAIDRRYDVLVRDNGGSIGVKRRDLEDELRKQAETDVATTQLYDVLVSENGGADAVKADAELKDRLTTQARDNAAELAKEGKLSPYPVAPALVEVPAVPALAEIPEPIVPRLQRLIDGAPAPSTAEETHAIGAKNTQDWEAGRETFRAENPDQAANPGERARLAAEASRASTKTTQDALIAFHRQAADRIRQAAAEAAAKEVDHQEANIENTRINQEREAATAAERAANEAEEDRQWLLALADLEDPAATSVEEIQRLVGVDLEEAQRIWGQVELPRIVQDARNELFQVYGMSEYQDSPANDHSELDDEVESREDMNGSWDDAGKKFYRKDENGVVTDVWNEETQEWWSDALDAIVQERPEPVPIVPRPEQEAPEKLRHKIARNLGLLSVSAGIVAATTLILGIANSSDNTPSAASSTAPRNTAVDRATLIANPTQSPTPEASATPQPTALPENLSGATANAGSPEPKSTATKAGKIERNPDGTYNVVLENGDSVWGGIDDLARDAGVTGPINGLVASSKNQTLKAAGLSEADARQIEPGPITVNLDPELIERMARRANNQN